MRRLRIRTNQKKTNAKLFTRKKSIVFFVFLIVCLVIIMVSLVVLDNLTVLVRGETVRSDDLPDALNGYTVLHVSDLHGQMTGTDHNTLFNAIKGRAYDAVLFTGDFTDKQNDGAEQENALALTRRFAELKKPVYFVRGNHDPLVVLTDDNGVSYVNPFFNVLEEAGAVYVDAPVQVTQRENGAVWLFPFEMLNLTRAQAQTQLDALEGPQENVQQELSRSRFERLIGALDQMQPSDLIIGMTHYPLTPERVNDFLTRVPDGAQKLSELTVVLSGHYHGGQIRVPLYGALYVPADTMGWRGFFPDNRYVRGLHLLENIVWQNISGGLGSTGVGDTDFMRLRLFSTPEVSLITFTNKAE